MSYTEQAKLLLYSEPIAALGMVVAGFNERAQTGLKRLKFTKWM